jgi:RNA polymerase sigma-70 factor (ECF subfamily)
MLIADEIEAAAGERDHIPDRRLALMFACAHPAIERGMRSPLILQTILGLTAEAIAGAFLIPPATMGQRLVRAKARIHDAGIPFRVPEREELAERLDAVLEAIYAAYGRGWAETEGGETPPLVDEAMWLAELVVALLPDEPEPKGMLALMLYAESRRAARRSPEGAFVPLLDQDTALWDEGMIARAEGLLRAANAGGPSGRYQVEAAIQSAHAVRRVTGAPAWPAIVQLYDVLIRLTGSPVAALNRAAALAEIEGPGPALLLLDEVASDRRMASYQPFWAAQGHLLARAGRNAEAHEALTRAAGLSTDPAVRAWLMAKRDALPRDG